MTRRGATAIVLLALAAALLLRLPDLAARPMHGDEAVHAYKCDALRATGRYVYDPFEFHGPTLYYLTLPILKLAGVEAFAASQEWHYRLTPALVGAASIAALLLLHGALRPAAIAFAAILMAVSPALVYYSRYYIQETLLAAFALLAVAAGWRFAIAGSLGWAACAGVAVGLMHATKETSVLAFAAMLGGGVLVRVVNHSRPRLPDSTAAELVADKTMVGTAHPTVARSLEGLRPRLWPGLIVAAAAACLTSVAFFSGFFTHASGPLDSLRALAVYLNRAGGAGGAAVHQHPWYYYLSMLLHTHAAPGPHWSEALILLLAAVGAAAVLGGWLVARRGRNSSGTTAGRAVAGGPDHAPQPAGLPMFLLAFVALQVVAYSALPYKTPWCLVQFLTPMALLAGIGADAWLTAARPAALRVVLAAAILLGTGQLAMQARLATGRFAADARNPYAYAHPLAGASRLGAWLETLQRTLRLSAGPTRAGQAPGAAAARPFVVKVIHENCWPLPWYFRRLEHVGYWETLPEDVDVDADVIVVAESLAEPLRARLHESYADPALYALRPGDRLLCYVRAGLWREYLEHARAAEGSVASRAVATTPATAPRDAVPTSPPVSHAP